MSSTFFEHESALHLPVDDMAYTPDGEVENAMFYTAEIKDAETGELEGITMEFQGIANAPFSIEKVKQLISALSGYLGTNKPKTLCIEKVSAK